MTTFTIKQIAQSRNIPESLVRAVIKQIGGKSSFVDNAENVTNHGASGGYCGFVWYSDTYAFYARNQKAIVDLASNLADDIGEGSAMSLVSSFNCLQGDSTPEEVALTLYGTKKQYDTQVANALAWFALEEVCRAYCDLIEEQE